MSSGSSRFSTRERLKSQSLAGNRPLLANVSPSTRSGEMSNACSHRSRQANDWYLSQWPTITPSFEIIRVFAVVFRRTAAHETILLPDETISRFGADVRKHRMSICPNNKTADGVGT
jgi:hypothetical protein